MELFIQITVALMLGYMIYRIWPAAKHWLQHGPKGDSKDWMTFVMIMAGVAGFVVLLIFLVKSA